MTRLARLCVIVFLTHICASTATAQTPPGQSAQMPQDAPPSASSMLPFQDAYSVYRNLESGNFFWGGLGITYFNNQLFYTVSLAPELAFGQFGIGIDLNLRISQSGQLRQEDWNDGISSYLRLIRYARYGFKQEPLYARYGQLDAARLGHGSIMFLYRNNGSYDARRVGFEFDMDFGDAGFETIVSDLSTFNIVGIRPFVRPLHNSGLFLLSGLEIGATFVGDFNSNSNLQAGSEATLTGRTENGQAIFDLDAATRRSSFLAFGIDAGLPIVRLPMINSDLYLDGVGYVGYGVGVAAGISANIQAILNVLVVSAKLEQRLFTDRFQFAYFDAIYEQDRFRAIGGGAITRANELANTKGGAGVYGELGGSILGIIRLYGSYQRLYATPRAGQLHLAARLQSNDLPVLLRADYFKRDLGVETDLFTVDDRSLGQAEFGYLPYPYLLVSVLYQWSFTPVRGENNTILGYRPLERIEPRVSLNVRF
jgi:hypothetical protein